LLFSGGDSFPSASLGTKFQSKQLVVFSQVWLVDFSHPDDFRPEICIITYLLYTCRPNEEMKAKTPLHLEPCSHE